MSLTFCSLSQKTPHFLNWRHSSSKPSYLLLYKISNNPQIRSSPGSRDLGGHVTDPSSLCLPESFQFRPGGHLPCMSKTGCRASWCRGRWPHSGCQGQTLFLSKAHRHYHGLIKHSFLYFENIRSNLKTNYNLNKIYIINKYEIYNLWALQSSSSRYHKESGELLPSLDRKERVQVSTTAPLHSQRHLEKASLTVPTDTCAFKSNREEVRHGTSS